MMYSVTGVLHRPELVVAEHDETTGTPDLETLDYQEAANTIGYDWKSYSGSEYDVDSDTGYYIKFPNTMIYRVVFLEFEGSGTGNVEFEVTYMEQLDSQDFSESGGFSLYPNPASKKVDLVFDMPGAENNSVEINVFNVSGKNVLSTTLNNSGNFTHKTLDISDLSSGMYLVQINSGKNFITRKLVVK